VSYEPQAHLLGHKVDWITTTFEDNWRLTPESLDAYCENRSNQEKPLILVLNYPNNPTGQTFNPHQLEQLAGVMQKHNVIVIADEIYALLTYEDKQASIADYYPQGCIITSGLSKWCGAGGWRLGFTYIPPALGKNLFRAVIAAASETYSCAAAPIQVAATAAYQDLDLAIDFLSRQKKILSEVNKYCTERLNKAGIKVHPCEGGFYIFPDFSAFKSVLSARGITTSTQLTEVIVDEIGVALLPGTAFGMPDTSLTTRLAFVDFDGEQVFDDSLPQLEFNTVKKGINKLCNWLESDYQVIK
jgi:aspartate aminotransferase